MLTLVLAATLAAYSTPAAHNGVQVPDSVRLIPGTCHLITRDKGPDPAFWATPKLDSVPIGVDHPITRDKGPNPAFWGLNENETVPAAPAAPAFPKGYVPDL